MSKNWKFNLPSKKTSSSRLETVPETSVASNPEPSVTTAVKSMAHVLLGPAGRTPIDNIIQMQHFQLWGFLLVVAGLLYIVWLMQKKLDAIDKQYKEQFVLLHRLFKSHQDLQVEVRKTTTAKQQQRTVPSVVPTSVPSVPSLPTIPSVPSTVDTDVEEEEPHNTLELADEPELCFDELADIEADEVASVDEPRHEEVVDFTEEWNEPVQEVGVVPGGSQSDSRPVEEEGDYETFE